MPTTGLLYFFVLFTISLRNWLIRHFGETTFEQLYFHLQYGAENLISSEKGLIWSFFNECVFNSLAIAIVLVALKKLAIAYDLTGKLSRLTRFDWQKLLSRKYLAPKARTAALLAFAAITFFYSLSVSQIFSGLFNSDRSFAAHYIAPKGQNITSPSSDHKNLVLIYLESFEQGLRSTDRYGRNLLQPLDDLDVPHQQFPRFWQMDGTQWSIAGMVASQCGIPLRPPIFGRNNFGQTVEKFLPGAVCLGDILGSKGYRNILLAGMSLDFAGVGKFYRQHGYDEVIELKDWQKQGAAGLGSWAGAMHDDELLSQAKAKLDALQAADQPFNMTILSIDTHSPGFISTDCQASGCRSLLDVYRFTAKVTADFIRYADAQGYLDTTRIVVLGDHLSMDQGIRSRDGEAPEYIYNLFVGDEPALEKNRDDISHFDFLPTILRFMGFAQGSERLGLGIAAVGDIATHKTTEEYALEQRTPLSSAKDYVALFYEQASVPSPAGTKDKGVSTVK